ncbi:MAG: insulinase family protein [Bacteroidaceae bacterium]|nr:insulinase family protein [Bacteroidaceae bacterium]
MKKTLLMCISVLLLAACQSSHKYESVKGDPMQARIYTLDNGLKIYLSVNKDQPRIQTYIAVRVGGKNDPSQNTGLAHYLEHLMFKGTTSFGTSDYEKEAPLLDQIEQLYEVYRTKTDPDERRNLYHQIDSISHEASKYAIANEYDKLMSSIGSIGTNAYTSEDVTCYTEDIPSNEVENWAKIQSDRFKDMVIRGFHTELEAVYEEYNISLTRDIRKVFQAANNILFPNHPYGQQTVLGSQEHLKNPSITTIKEHFSKWYVPNNVAICMSGDFDPDEVVDIIERYFGDWEPNPDIPALHDALPKDVKPLTEPVVRDIYGPEQEETVLAWAFPGKKDPAADYLSIIEQLLSNNKAGLFDIDLNQAQTVLASGAGNYAMSDYSMLLALGYPKEGQSLEDVRNLMIAEIEKLKAGDFDDTLLEAIINNMKLSLMHQLEDNESRANMFVESFVNGTEWKDEVERIDRLSKITKADVVDFACHNLTNGYACIYKRQGVDPNEKKIDKPAISPIETNRDKTSPFVQAIVESKVKPIEPVFVDYNRDLSTATLSNGNELIYKQNTSNQIFSLRYRIARGDKADPHIQLASTYLDYLGTSELVPEKFKAELYRLACSISISTDDEETVVSISGLAENMPAAVALCEQWMHDAVADQAVYDNLVDDLLKSRADAKLNQQNCFARLRAWGMYGPQNSYTNILSAMQLKAIDPQALLDTISNLQNYQQTIVYYGPMAQDEFTDFIEANHHMADRPIPLTETEAYTLLDTPENEVYIAPYVAKNIYMTMYSSDGQSYNPQLVPDITMFNEYYGGGMNAIVFQELREARGLAYSASANYATGAYATSKNSFYTYIITQNDKMPDCINTFHDILANMPQSASAFQLAKDAILKRIATERTIKQGVLSSFLNARRHNLDHDINSDIYARVSDMTLEDVVEFHKNNIANRTYKYLILGDESDLDMEYLSTLGNIHRVTLADIFGY